MRYHSLTTTSLDAQSLDAEYKGAREVGIIRLGETCLFFKKQLKKYYIPYEEITRCFRRVVSVPARLCCGKGDFSIENLVVYVGDMEIAQIQLPGTKAARILIEELKLLIPHAEFSRPDDVGKEISK